MIFQMQYGADNVTKIDLNNDDTFLVEDIPFLFYDCKKLSNLNFLILRQHLS